MSSELAVLATNCGCIAGGATLGACARFGVAEIGKHTAFGKAHPYCATIAVNIVGSFLLGALAGAVRPGSRGALLAGTGFCGSFTTFSTYSVEVVRLVQAGSWSTAGFYVTSSSALSIGAAACGMNLASSPPAAASMARLLAKRPMLRRWFPPPVK